MNELLVLAEGREIARLTRKQGRLKLTYAESWRSAPGAYPLSVSMPLAAAEHLHAAVESFLWGLLPDNDLILSRWAQRYQVSPRSVFGLLNHVGEDCPGAAQFVRPERAAELLQGSAGEVEWLTEEDICGRLRALQTDASAWRAPNDIGQFSLAGAQPKTALTFDGRRWGVPSGRMPTTHILKPPTGGLDGHVENEHLCLSLARALGVPTARSEIRRFGDIPCIVVERYDRVRAREPALSARAGDAPTAIHRVHQEDFCQALGIHPARKYQNEGGPGPRQIIDLLRAFASAGDRATRSALPPAGEEDVGTFTDALIFNWLIGGTDAHAKNYSILIGGHGLVRLAPLYDLASILPYRSVDLRKARLAMRIGDEYRLAAIGSSQWRSLAMESLIDPDRLLTRMRSMAAALPDLLSDEVETLRREGLSNPVIRNLQTELAARSAQCART